MAYNGGNHRAGQQYGSQYPEEYFDGYNRGQAYPASTPYQQQQHQQPSYEQQPNGTEYHNAHYTNGASPNQHANYGYSSHSTQHQAYPTYTSGQSNHAVPATNTYGQQYYPPTPQYNPQAYSLTTPQYSAQQSYNPSAYASNYGQAQSGAVQYPAAQSQQIYSPANYASPTIGSPRSGSYGQPSPNPPSQQWYHSSQGASNSQQPMVSPPLGSPSGPTQPQHYSTYSQPAPQTATYVPSSYHEPPYPEQDFAPTFSNLSVQDHPYPSVSPALTDDEMNLPSPPSQSERRSSRFSLSRDRPPSVSPVYTPENRSNGHSPPPAAPPHRAGTLNRHPQSRPLPGRPEPERRSSLGRRADRDSGADYDAAQRAQDDLFAEVENAVMNAGSPAAIHDSSPRSRSGTNASTGSRHSPQPLFGSHSRVTRNASVVNGHLSPQPSVREGALYEEDSDQEGAAGLALMQAAEEEETRRQSGNMGRYSGYSSYASPRSDNTRTPQQHVDEDDEYDNVDMSVLSGGFDAPMSYVEDPNAHMATASSNGASASHPPSSSGSFRNPAGHGRLPSYDYGMDDIAPPPAYQSAARVDAEGTGGLSDPSAGFRRQSFNEGDEEAFHESDLVAAEPPDLFYHPQTSIYRPLPPPPSTSSSSIQGIVTPTSSSSGLNPPHPLDSNYVQSTTAPGTWVPRSTSLVHHRPQVSIDQPIRSKTDAEERSRKQLYRNSFDQRNSMYSAFDTTPTTPGIGIDLPSLPSKRFVASKLGAADFKKCEEPWALSSLNKWLRQIADPDQITELRESLVKEALVLLFTHKVPTMNITDAELLSTGVVDNMYQAGTLRKTEEWVRLCSGTMSGVIFQLTQSGCYSPTLHKHVTPGRCYSTSCQRTLRKVVLSALPSRASEDWATFYKLKKEDVEGRDKKEIERQNNLHEIVQTEEDYMQQLNVLQVVYRDAIARLDPPIMSSKKLPGFLKDVFGKVDGVKKANEEHLLAQLKYRQEEQGPWISGLSDIFRQWIRKAKTAYIDYAAGFPGATLLMRQQLESSPAFAGFIEKARSNKMADRLGWDTYLKAPITRLQRYSLLLSVVLKNTIHESSEKTNLQVAIDEIKAVTLDCDARVAEMQRKVDLADLTQKLALRQNMQQEVKLNLTHLGRELIYRGDLQRTGGNRFNWLDCHALLFDHYMILAKSVFVTSKETGAKIERYDVSRLPIPMDLLVLESTNEDAVMKSTYMGGLTSVTTVSSRPTISAASSSTRTGSASDLSRIVRSSTSQSTSNATSAPTAYERSSAAAASQASLTSTVSAPPAVTNLGDSKDSDKIVYPFRIKHLGREPYTLFAPSASNRQEWCNKIIEAKTKHANALFAQSAEPFRLRVIADSAFYYDYSLGSLSGANKSIIIKGTPIDRAIKEVEKRFKDTGRPGPVCRAKVNCACNFTTPYPGKHMVAVGTEYGLYVSEIDNPRGWTKAISIGKITQIAVLEEFSLILLLSNGALIAYHLDAVCSPDRIGTTNDNSSSRKAPQKLSGSRDVGFFSVARMKDRTLVFYKKREGLSSTFKVLEPVFQKSTEKKRGMFKRGTTEFFRDYDEFYIPTECSGISLFQSSLAVSTSKGFEVLTLDKKQPFSVPDLRAPEVASIATHIADQQTLGMLRLSEQEFLLCYEKCAVYVNKHGDVSRSVIMHYVGRARAAALYGPYLILFDTDFVEVRDAQNGRLKQIIAGRDVKCLDDGGGGTVSGGSVNGASVINGVPQMGAGARPVKVVMQHPENEKVQILVELVLDAAMKE